MRVSGGPNPLRRRGGRTFVQNLQRRIIKEEIHKKVRVALDAVAVELLDVARQLSSGTVDSAKAGHPYARAHPNSAFDPGLINVGFGKHPGKRFADAWELLPKSQGPGIRNTSWVAKFLEPGTKRMVARPIDKLILKQADKIIGKHLAAAFASDGTATLSGASLSIAA